jgi:hypothetical protein
MPYNTSVSESAWNITSANYVGVAGYETLVENCTVTPRYDGGGVALSGNVTFRNCNIVNGIYTNDYVNNYTATTPVNLYENATIVNTPTNGYVTGLYNTPEHYVTNIDYGTGDNYVGIRGVYNTGTGVTYNIVSNDFWGYSVSPEEIKTQQKKERLKSNLVIQIKSRAELPKIIPDNERIAMETLREVITEAEFRKYIKYGFIMVKGESGDDYQIFRNKSHTKVWRAGKVIEEVCVRIKHEEEAPPTDNVIAFRTIIQSNELAFKKLGNVYKMTGRVSQQIIGQIGIARAA